MAKNKAALVHRRGQGWGSGQGEAAAGGRLLLLVAACDRAAGAGLYRAPAPQLHVQGNWWSA